jgi:hypothetical protein
MNSLRRLIARTRPALLLVLLGVALVAPTPALLRLASGDPSRASQFAGLIDALPIGSIVLVAFDPDLGTYAEIRPTVRTALSRLLDRDARLSFLSLTPEGRALAVAEIARIRAEVPTARTSDLGYLSGAEAGLVAAVNGWLIGTETVTGDSSSLAGQGIAAAELVVVVGGNDLGPRSWIEQAATRLPDLRIAALAPTMLYPELQPYVASGQLEALIGTVGDGAAYRALVGSRVDRPTADVRALPILVGMLVAVAVWGVAIGSRGLRAARGVLGGRGST